MASYLSAEIIRRLAVRHGTAPSLPDKLWDHRSLSLTKQTVRYTKSSHGLGFLHVDNVKGQNIFKSWTTTTINPSVCCSRVAAGCCSFPPRLGMPLLSKPTPSIGPARPASPCSIVKVPRQHSELILYLSFNYWPTLASRPVCVLSMFYSRIHIVFHCIDPARDLVYNPELRSVSERFMFQISEQSKVSPAPWPG